MRSLRALVLAAAVVFGFAGVVSAGPIFKPSSPSATPQGAGPVPFDPMALKHGAYADYLRISLNEVAAAWKENMGGQDITKADNAIEFGNFFFFVRQIDPAFVPHYITLKDLLKNAEKHQEAMRKAADRKDRADFSRNFEMTIVDVQLMDHALLEIRDNLLKAIEIYGVPLKEIAYPPGEAFRELESGFAKNVTDAIREMGEKSFPTPKGTDIHLPDVDELDMMYGVLADLLYYSSYKYEKADGSKNFVSFLTYGGASIHPWPDSYGGEGPMETPAMSFLWH